MASLDSSSVSAKLKPWSKNCANGLIHLLPSVFLHMSLSGRWKLMHTFTLAA